jgi:putative Mn2+ efflux pump MntP
VWEAVALALALAMDATAVSAARALGAENRREVVVLPIVFGGFQAGMAALGWLGGSAIQRHLAGYDVWIAFGLLVAIGAKMIWDGVRASDGDPPAPGSAMLYLGLGIATSIDAAAAGVTLPQLDVEPWLAITLIGVITAACAALGHLAGRALAEKVGGRLAIVGGVVLVGIGIRMVLA